MSERDSRISYAMACFDLQTLFADPKVKINFNVKLVLVATEEWVQCGSYLDMCYSPRSIAVRIVPTALQPGVHQAYIRAFDSNNVAKGFLFEIPITVVQPVEVSAQEMFSTRESKQCNTSRLVGDFGTPISQHVLPGLLRPLASLGVLLRILPVLVPVWTPFEVYDSLNFDTLLRLQAHGWQLVYADLLTRGGSGHKFIIRTPL